MNKILDLFKSPKIASAYLNITRDFKDDIEKLIKDIKDIINIQVDVEIKYEIPNQESCVILSEFVDSLYPTHIQELQKIINELFSDTTHNVIDYINFSISREAIRFTSTSVDMKSKIKDVIHQIHTQEARTIEISTINSVYVDFIKYMMILDILLVYLNKIKQQHNSLFISIMPCEYIFHFFVLYIIYTQNYYSKNFINLLFLNQLIISILENLLFINRCDIKRTYSRVVEYQEAYTQLASQLSISDDLYNLIDCLKFLFEESNQESLDNDLHTRIYITDLHALFKLDKWDANFKLIYDECVNFHTLLFRGDNEFCIYNIDDIIKEMRKLNQKFKADTTLVHILSLLRIYIKFLLLKNIYKETSSDTHNDGNIDKMKALLKEGISPIEFIKKYITLISESSEILVTFEPDQAWIEQRDKSREILKRITQSSSGVASSLAALSALSSSRVGSSSSLAASSAYDSSLAVSSARALSSSRVGSSLSSLSAHGLSLATSNSSSSSAASNSSSSSAASSSLSSMALRASSAVQERALTQDELKLISDAIDKSKLEERESLTHALKHTLEISKSQELIKQSINIDPQKKRPGLQNLGNTCFLNSLLQLLYSIIDLREKIVTVDEVVIDEDYSANSALALALDTGNDPKSRIRDSREDDPQFQILRSADLLRINKKKATTIIQSLRTLFIEMSTSSGSPVNHKSSIQRIFNTQGMVIGNQEDCSEFLRFIFSAIQETDNMQDLFNLFKMNFVEKKTCVATGDQYDLEFPNSFDYSLELEPCNTIQESIMSFLKNEVISEPTNFLKDWCENQPFSKQMNIVFNPQFKYFILSIKKTQGNIHGAAFSADKIIKPVTVNGIIRVPNYNNQHEPYIYFVLQGLCYHVGGAKGGHYFYLEFDQTGSIVPIRSYNDSDVQDLKLSDASRFDIHTNGYLFLYKKINIPPNAGGGIKNNIQNLSKINESKWKNKYLKYKQKYLKLANKII